MYLQSVEPVLQLLQAELQSGLESVHLRLLLSSLGCWYTSGHCILDVERQTYHVAYIQWILVGLLAEEIEMYFFGKALERLEHIFLLVPFVAGLRGARCKWQLYDDFTCYFH